MSARDIASPLVHPPVKLARQVHEDSGEHSRRQEERAPEVQTYTPEAVQQLPRAKLQLRDIESSTQQQEDISNFFDSLKTLDKLKHQEDQIHLREMEQRARMPQVPSK